MSERRQARARSRTIFTQGVKRTSPAPWACVMAADLRRISIVAREVPAATSFALFPSGVRHRGGV